MAYQFKTRLGRSNNMYGYDPVTGENLGLVYGFGNVNDENAPYRFTLPEKWLTEHGGFTQDDPYRVTLNPATLQAALADQAFATSGIYDNGTPWTGDPSRIAPTGSIMSYDPASAKDPAYLDYGLPILAGGFTGPAISGLTSSLGLPSFSLTDLLSDVLGNTSIDSGAISGGQDFTNLAGSNTGTTGTDLFDDALGVDYDTFGGGLDWSVPTSAGSAAAGTTATGAIDPTGGFPNYGGAVDETGAFDQYGSLKYPDAGTVETIFGSGSGGTGINSSTVLKGLAGMLPSLFGAAGAWSTSNSLKDLADKYGAYGAPYRARLADLYKDPTSFLSSPEVTVPVQMGTNILGNTLSTKFGNPAGSGTALQEMQNYASNQLFSRLGQEKDRLGGFGGLTYYNQMAPQIDIKAAGSEGNIWNAIGSGISSVVNPQPTLEDIFKMYKSLNSGVV